MDTFSFVVHGLLSAILCFTLVRWVHRSICSRSASLCSSAESVRLRGSGRGDGSVPASAVVSLEVEVEAAVGVEAEVEVEAETPARAEA